MTRKECIDGMQRIIDEDRNKILVRVHAGYLIHAVKYLKDQPEIVRCKDCKFAEKTGFCRPKEDEYKCTLSEFEGCYDYHDGEWFCADGKLS